MTSLIGIRLERLREIEIIENPYSAQINTPACRQAGMKSCKINTDNNEKSVFISGQQADIKNPCLSAQKYIFRRSQSRSASFTPLEINKSLTGFTLIELVVVVLIIGSLIALSLPRFRETFNNLIFDNFCQNLAGRIRYLQERAYVGQDVYQLSFDLSHKIIEIKVKDKTSGQFIENKGLLVRRIIIPENIEIETQTPNIIFLPDGAIEGKDIKISGFQNSATIFINESLGKVKLEKDEQ